MVEGYIYIWGNEVAAGMSLDKKEWGEEGEEREWRERRGPGESTRLAGRTATPKQAILVAAGFAFPQLFTESTARLAPRIEGFQRV